MKIVMCYTDGDGYTYSCDVALPIEYESPEAALVEFEIACKAARYERREFRFGGHLFYPETFFWRDTSPDRFDPPDFLTVDEWFATVQSGGA
jgi:hypothetical protein